MTIGSPRCSFSICGGAAIRADETAEVSAQDDAFLAELAPAPLLSPCVADAARQRSPADSTESSSSLSSSHVGRTGRLSSHAGRTGRLSSAWAPTSAQRTPDSGRVKPWPGALPMPPPPPLLLPQPDAPLSPSY